MYISFLKFGIEFGIELKGEWGFLKGGRLGSGRAKNKKVAIAKLKKTSAKMKKFRHDLVKRVRVWA